MPLQAARMKLTEITQLRVADISYIRLKAEFVHLEAWPLPSSTDSTTLVFNRNTATMCSSP